MPNIDTLKFLGEVHLLHPLVEAMKTYESSCGDKMGVSIEEGMVEGF